MNTSSSAYTSLSHHPYLSTWSASCILAKAPLPYANHELEHHLSLFLSSVSERSPVFSFYLFILSHPTLIASRWLSPSSFLPCFTSIETRPVRFSPARLPNGRVDIFAMHVSACHSLDENCSRAPH